jgi:hypothetical protein
LISPHKYKIYNEQKKNYLPNFLRRELMDVLEKEVLYAILGSSVCPEFYFLDKLSILHSTDLIRLYTDLNIPTQRRKILAKKLEEQGTEKSFPNITLLSEDGTEFLKKGFYWSEFPSQFYSKEKMRHVAKKIQQIRDEDFFRLLVESLDETEQYLFLDTIILSENEIEEIYQSLPLFKNDIICEIEIISQKSNL